MKLPYTPLQFARATSEEDGGAGGALGGHAGRLLLAAQPGRAGRARRSEGCASRTCSSPAARCRCRCRTRCGRCGSAGCSRLDRRRWRRASTATCSASRVGLGARLGRAREHDVAVCSVGPGIVGTGTPLRSRRPRGCRRGERGDSRSAARRSSRARVRRRRAGAAPGRVPPHRAVLALVRGEVVVAEPSTVGARRARDCRSRTWAAARTRIRTSSRPPTARASRRARCSVDSLAAA